MSTEKKKTPAWTPRLAAALSTIRKIIERDGFAPSLKELADELDVSVTGVHQRLGDLVALGLLEYESRNTRTMRLTNKPIESLFMSQAA